MRYSLPGAITVSGRKFDGHGEKWVLREVFDCAEISLIPGNFSRWLIVPIGFNLKGTHSCICAV